MRIFIIAFLGLALFGCVAEKVVPPTDTSATEVVATAATEEDVAMESSELPPPMYMLFSSADASENDKANRVLVKAGQSAADRLSDLFTSCGYNNHFAVNPPSKKFDIYHTWGDAEDGQFTMYVWLSPRAFKEYTMFELHRLGAGKERTQKVATCLRKFGYLQ